MKYTPYPNTAISYAIPEDKMEELRKTFPKDNFYTYYRKMGHDKTYKLRGRHLILPGKSEPEFTERLSKEWKMLCDDLLSVEYRDTIGKLIEKDLSNCYLGVDLWRSNPGDGCFIGAHADLPWKAVTHVMYFVKEWDESWGGLLGIHDCHLESDCVNKIAPSLEVSAILVRSDESFHSIGEVYENGKECRKVLDIVFYNEMPPAPKPGRIVGELVPEEEFIDLD